MDSDASSDDDDGSDAEETIEVQVGDDDDCELDDEANALMDNAVAGPHEELKADLTVFVTCPLEDLSVLTMAKTVPSLEPTCTWHAKSSTVSTLNQSSSSSCARSSSSLAMIAVMFMIVLAE